ncbi:uncharacterized protein LOC144652565 [Oculina patagonica]
MEQPRSLASEINTDENVIKSGFSTGNETLEGSVSSDEGNHDTVIPKICVQPVDHKTLSVLDHLGVDMCSELRLSTNNNISRRISEDKSAAMHKDKDKLRPDDRLARRRKQSLSLDPQILLQWAATHNDVETLRNVLESSSADVNEPGVDGFYALHRAASTGSFECLQYLVTKGAQLEVRDKDGSSPLDAAVYEGEFDCAQFLIEKGASIHHIRDGFTDRKLVKIRGRKRVMTLV